MPVAELKALKKVQEQLQGQLSGPEELKGHKRFAEVDLQTRYSR